MSIFSESWAIPTYEVVFIRIRSGKKFCQQSALPKHVDSCLTADIAGSYHRDCFAFPGRVTDEYSKGCNQLIQDNKAVLLESASDFVKTMGWDSDLKSVKPETVQRNLFPDLSAEELRIVDILGKLGDLQINALMVQADIPINKISAILFELEMKGVIRVLAGGVYQLLR